MPPLPVAYPTTLETSWPVWASPLSSYYVKDVHADHHGKVWVTTGNTLGGSSDWNKAILRFSDTGTLETSWQLLPGGDWDFLDPIWLCSIPGSTDIFVATAPARVLRFTDTGTLVDSWGDGYDPYGGIPAADGQLYPDIGGIAHDGTFLYVPSAMGPGYPDGPMDKVTKYTTSGAFVSDFGSTGKLDGEFTGAGAVTVDGDGSLLVGEYSVAFSLPDRYEWERIQRFTGSGGHLATYGALDAPPLEVRDDKWSGLLAVEARADRVAYVSFGSALQAFPPGATFVDDAYTGSPAGWGGHSSPAGYPAAVTSRGQALYVLGSQTIYKYLVPPTRRRRRGFGLIRARR